MNGATRLNKNRMGNNSSSSSYTKTYPAPSRFLDMSMIIPAVEDYERPKNPRETPELYVYCSYRNWDSARRQLELGRGLEYVSPNRRFSVLHVAVENHAPIELVKMILGKGIDPNIADTIFDQTPLHIIMKTFAEGNSVQVLQTLLEAGGNINSQAKYGRTPLYFAIKHNSSNKVIAYVLRVGARITKELIVLAKEKTQESTVILLERTQLMVCMCTGQQLERSRSSIKMLSRDLMRLLNRFLYKPVLPISK